MTGLELSLLITATGGLLVGGVAYWIATRPGKEHRHPAE